MESNTPGMSTCLQKCAVIEFLTTEKVNTNDIQRHLKAVYGDETVDRITVSRWPI